ncbi:ABC transporter substrate-binding protein [soil metagenome]
MCRLTEFTGKGTTRAKLLPSFLSATLLGASLCFGASAARAEQPEPLADSTTLTIGQLKVAHLSPISLALEKLAGMNVDVELVEFQRYADARTALASGSVDVAMMGPPDVPIAVSQGIDSIIGLMGVGSWSAYPVVRNDVEIKGWEDLAGKRVGVGPASTVWFQFVAAATEAGFDYSDMEIVNVQGGGAAFNQALQRGDIDVAITWEPFDSIPVVEGYGYWATEIDYSKSDAVGGELGIIGANREALNNKREAIRHFVWAYVDAQRELEDSPDQWAQAIQRYTEQPQAVAENIVKRNIEFDPVPDIEQIKIQARKFHELGVIPTDVSDQLDDYFDVELVQSVM